MKALKNYKFNAFVQLFNLGLLPVSIWAISRVLIDIQHALSEAVCAFLPMTVNTSRERREVPFLPMTVNMVIVLN